MRRILLCCTALSALLVPAIAHADGVDQFTLHAGAYTVQFALPASPMQPTTDACKVDLPPEFCFTAVPVTSNGVTGLFDIDFFDGSTGGGLDITQGFYDYFDKTGPQLYSGPVTSPTFTLGTFSLTDFYNETPATLTIAQTPEPGTWALTLTGLSTAVGCWQARRKA